MLTATAPPPRASIGPWISRGIALIREQPGKWALMSLVALGPMVVAVAAIVLFQFVAIASIIPVMKDPTAPHPNAGMALGVGTLVGVVVGIVTAIVLSGFLSIGLWQAAFRQLRSGEAPGVDAFEGTLALVPRVLLTGLCVSAVVLVGTLMCILPGLVAAAAFQFAIPLTIERELGPIEAMSQSWEATRGDLLGYTLHSLAVGILSSLGSYLCWVGILLTYPLHFTATAAAYRDLFPESVASPRGFEPRLPP